MWEKGVDDYNFQALAFLGIVIFFFFFFILLKKYSAELDLISTTFLPAAAGVNSRNTIWQVTDTASRRRNQGNASRKRDPHQQQVYYISRCRASLCTATPRILSLSVINDQTLDEIRPGVDF